MSKKTKQALAVGGLLALPIVYKQFEIPESTTDQIVAFIIGIVTTLSAQKVQTVRREKAERKKENGVS